MILAKEVVSGQSRRAHSVLTPTRHHWGKSMLKLALIDNWRLHENQIEIAKTSDECVKCETGGTRNVMKVKVEGLIDLPKAWYSLRCCPLTTFCTYSSGFFKSSTILS